MHYVIYTMNTHSYYKSLPVQSSIWLRANLIELREREREREREGGGGWSIGFAGVNMAFNHTVMMQYL